MPEDELPPMPSLELVLNQVASERATMDAHGESLDSKAGVVLGFSGVIVGLGATAMSVISDTVLFQIGLGLAVFAAAWAAWAFAPRGYPVLEARPLREKYLTLSEVETRLRLLDTQVDMVEEAAALVKRKGRRVLLSVIFLALAAALIVAGTLTAGGPHHG